MPGKKRVRAREVTRLRRSTNTKDTARGGTYIMQRESLMLSRLRMYWEVILENHFPSLAGGFFCVRTSNRALYASSPLTFSPGGLSLPIPDRLASSSRKITTREGCRRGQRMLAGCKVLYFSVMYYAMLCNTNVCFL